MRDRTGQLWSASGDAYSTGYVNDRNSAWGYDGAGNPTTQETLTAKYNSAGQRSSTTSPARHIGAQVVNLKLFEGYDGDGQQVAETQETTVGSTTTQITTYKIRSSVLGGQIIAELTSTGAKQTGYVYANGRLIARQQFGSVTWVHFSPTNLSERWTNTSGQLAGASEYDPAHSAVGLDDPGPGPDGTSADLLYPRNGDPSDLSGGCTIDGMVAPCSVAMSLVNVGADVATNPYETPSGIAPIIWTSGSQKGQTGFAVFHAFADGFSNFIPTNGRYAGNGIVEAYTVTDREVRKDRLGTIQIEYWGWVRVQSGAERQGTNINFLPNDGEVYSPQKWNPIIKQIIQSFLDNSDCVSAYAQADVNLAELLKYGIDIGPSNSFQNMSAQQLKLNQAQYNQGSAWSKSKGGLFTDAGPAITTVSGNGTTDHVPKMFLRASAFEGGLFQSSISYLREVLAHELLHAGGWDPKPHKWTLGAQDLDWLGERFKRVMKRCP